MPLPSTVLTVPCKPPAIIRLEPSSRVPRAIVVFLMSFRYMGVFSVMVVLSMPPRLQRGCGSSCQCLRYAAYTHELSKPYATDVWRAYIFLSCSALVL